MIYQKAYLYSSLCKTLHIIYTGLYNNFLEGQDCYFQHCLRETEKESLYQVNGGKNISPNLCRITKRLLKILLVFLLWLPAVCGRYLSSWNQLHCVLSAFGTRASLLHQRVISTKYHGYLGSSRLWQSLSLSYFLMTVAVLKTRDPVFCIMSFVWNLFDNFLTTKSGPMGFMEETHRH